MALLAPALTALLRKDDHRLADAYSQRALRRVWRCTHFSWWMTTMRHRFPAADDAFDERIAETELAYLEDSRAAQTAFAENYTGLPYRLPSD